MKFSKALALLVVGAVVGWQLVSLEAANQAIDEEARQIEAPADLPLQVVSYSSGLTGFFDPSTKTLYLYGADLKTPFMISQVEKLGEPLKVIKAAGK